MRAWIARNVLAAWPGSEDKLNPGDDSAIIHATKRHKEPLMPSPFEPRCLPTTLGSLPHTDIAQATALLIAHTPEIPAWVQLPKRAWRENMMVQYLEGMPGVVEENERAYFDTSRPGYEGALMDFFARYLAQARQTACDGERSGHRPVHVGHQPHRPESPLRLL
jgi:hypothetical protein